MARGKPLFMIAGFAVAVGIGATEALAAPPNPILYMTGSEHRDDRPADQRQVPVEPRR